MRRWIIPSKARQARKGVAPLAFAVLAALASDRALATADAYLGQVIIVGGNYCPSGFLSLDGQLLSTTTYEPLFDLIGAKYGGDGVTTFALPTVPPTRTATGEPVLYCIAASGTAFTIPVPD